MDEISVVLDSGEELVYVQVPETDRTRARREARIHEIQNQNTQVSHPNVGSPPLLSLPNDLTIKSKTNDQRLKEASKNPQIRTTKSQAALLTLWERKMLTILGECGSVKLTAQKLGTTARYLYQRLHLIRQKDTKSWTYTNDVEDYRINFPKLRKFLKKSY
jgi:hypothetical protein